MNPTDKKTLNRRHFLMGSVSAGALAANSFPTLSWASSAQQLGNKRFVFVLLRGGLDGLTVLPPVGDPQFQSQRGALAEFEDQKALALDGFFALHPALTFTHGLYAKKQLLPIHAVATSYRAHSHFDAQNLLESGGQYPFQLKSGWLNRAISMMPGYDGRAESAIGLGTQLPLILQGPTKVLSQSAAYPRAVDDDLLARLKRVYSDSQENKKLFEQATSSLSIQGSARNTPNQIHPFVASARAAAQALSAANGPRVAVLECDGYDSHAIQSTKLGLPWRELTAFDEAIRDLATGLGTHWANTLVVVVTEFGRTVKPNGSSGTDHGTGSAMFLMGGAVNGGRVLADWPGIRANQLHEARDLKPTQDMFAVFNSALTQHWNLDPQQSAKVLFPGYSLSQIPKLII
jgi:uncharacterized protein (DUF1501 family)